MRRGVRLQFKHFHFATLMIILFIGVAVFMLLAGNRPAQLGIGIGTAVAYVGWGVIHHASEGDLYPKVVIEYVLIAAIAIILLLTIVGY